MDYLGTNTDIDEMFDLSKIDRNVTGFIFCDTLTNKTMTYDNLLYIEECKLN